MGELLRPFRSQFMSATGEEGPSAYQRAMRTATRGFDKILDNNAGEREAHAYLKRHPMLVANAVLGYDPVGYQRAGLFSEVQLANDHRVDFALVTADSDGARWTLIELEDPCARLFTQGGDPTHELTHGRRQLTDWRAWIRDNREFAVKTLSRLHESVEGLRGPWSLWRDPTFMVIIGRESTLVDETRRRKAEMNDEDRRMQVATYDRILRNATFGEAGVSEVGLFETRRERGYMDSDPWPPGDMAG